MIITNSTGGKQTKIDSMVTEVPPLALLEVAKVMGEGSITYPREPDNSPNWYKIRCNSNLDHSLEHVFNFLAERNKPDRNKEYMREELAHFAARSLMALEQFIREESNA